MDDQLAFLERHVSPDRLLTFVVYEDDGDTTLGFEEFAWHTHADLLASAMGVPQNQAVRRFVDDLIEGRTIIAIRSIGGEMRDAWITDDPHADLKYKPDNEAVTFRLWDGSPVLPSTLSETSQPP
jgi:hypothetical protein